MIIQLTSGTVANVHVQIKTGGIGKCFVGGGSWAWSNLCESIFVQSEALDDRHTQL